MKLSMWIIRDALNEYQPVSMIENGAQVIKNIRYLSESSGFEKEYIYIGDSKDFFGSDSHHVFCVSGSDMLLLKTDDIYEVFNKILQIFEYYNTWEQTLIERIASGAALQELLDLSKDVFRYPLVITDASHLQLALFIPDGYPNKEYESYRDVPIPLDMLTIINKEIVHDIQNKTAYVHKTKAFSRPGIIRNLFRKDELIGWFVILDVMDENSQRLMQLCDTFAGLVEAWFCKHEDSSPSASQAGLFLDILSGKETDRSRLISRLQGIGWLEDDEKLVVQVHVNSINDLAFFTLKRILPQNFSGCYVISYKSGLVLVANLRLLSEKKLEALLSDILCQSQTYCGVSYKFTNVLKLNQYYRQAEIAVIYGNKKPGAINHCEEYAMDYLKDIIQDNLATDIRHPALKILKDYDTCNNTEYYKTLMEYLINERDQRKTARLMSIHRNTLVYRINRIEEILGIDLDKAHIRTHILISYFVGDFNERA